MQRYMAVKPFFQNLHCFKVSYSAGWTILNIVISIIGLVALSTFLSSSPSSSETPNPLTNITSSIGSMQDLVKGAKDVANPDNLVALGNQLLLVASPSVIGILLTFLFIILTSFPSLGPFHLHLDPAMLQTSTCTAGATRAQSSNHPMSIECSPA